MSTSAVPLFANSRFYILVSSFILSAAVMALLRLGIAADQLFYIRLEQVFGFLSLAYWYVALVISPIGHIIGKQRVRRIEYARRAIGVSAFYFALLHAGVAIWGQLGGIEQLGYLPDLFKWSLIGGAAGLGVLAIMAATSFDAVVKFMTFRRWKWLHRLVYAGGVLVLLHVWTVGTHLAYTNVQVAAFVALVVLGGLELFRVVKLANHKYLHLEKREVVTLYAACWSIVSVLIFMTPTFVQNYHSRHSSHAAEATEG